MINLEEIKFGRLTEHEIFFLQQKLKYETERRNKKPEEYYEVIYADDGSEGFYCKVEDFEKIKPEELHRQIALTLEQGSTISFSVEKIEKKEYDEHCKHYEWAFGDEDE